MKLAVYSNDTFHADPEGRHPMTASGWNITPDRLRDILHTHSCYRGVEEGTIWLRGPEYGGMAIHDVPAALLNDLNVPPLNAGERPPG